MIIKHGFVRERYGNWYNLANITNVFIDEDVNGLWRIRACVAVEDGSEWFIDISPEYPTEEIARSYLDAMFGYVW